MSLEISPMEFEILELMAGRIGRTISREEILKKIWGIGARTQDSRCPCLKTQEKA